LPWNPSSSRGGLREASNFPRKIPRARDIHFLARIFRSGDRRRGDTDQRPRHDRYALPWEYGELSAGSSKWSQTCTRWSCRPTAMMIWGCPSRILWKPRKTGPRQIECAVNGLGEAGGKYLPRRSGMALRDAPDLFGLDDRKHIPHQEIAKTSRLVPNHGSDGPAEQSDRRGQRIAHSSASIRTGS